MKKLALPLALSALALVSFEALAAGPPFERNTTARPGVHIDGPVAGGGLAPTTWGFVSRYEGSLYGTGYYAFQVDQTYAGVNIITGRTYNYQTAGFVTEIRAIYAFDVAGLDGQPSPVWSAFLLNTREAPYLGYQGRIDFENIALTSSGGVHRLTGLSSFQNTNAANLDIYDAEDFENAAPFANPQLAYTGTGQTLIGTQAVLDFSTVPIDFVVTDAVNNDLGITGGAPVVEVPVLGLPGITALALLLGLAGALLLRR